MALLNFPLNPANGELYPSTPLQGQSQYEWEALTQTWRLLGPATSVIPGCYGDGLTVPTFCVDPQGRITSAANVPIAVNYPDLQIVTDQGATTTNTIDVAGIIAAGLNYPLSDGASGDVLTTDGAGLLSWQTPPSAPNLQTVTDNGATTTNPVTVAELTAAGLRYPITDGVAGDYLTTDGVGSLGWVAPSVGTLQEVTDNGFASTNIIDVAGLVAAGLTYPNVDGTAGDVLTTDGAGVLGWSTPVVYDLQNVTDNGAVSTNVIDVAGLIAANLNYPLVDGAANEVLTTDGAGNLGWLSTVKVVAAPTASTDSGTLGEVAYDASYFYWFDGAGWQRVAAEATPW